MLDTETLERQNFMKLYHEAVYQACPPWLNGSAAAAFH